ncbi:glycosyltransferase family 4 protein [Nostoc ellipsosporum NOK]|nr:glycosyltransferase family 4 protein [Nostoc ellipsosporum NOK]
MKWENHLLTNDRQPRSLTCNCIVTIPGFYGVRYSPNFAKVFMVVVIDNRFSSARPGGFERYTDMLLHELAMQHPEYHFVVLTQRESEKGNTVENIARVVTRVVPSGLKKWWWQRVGLAKFLRRQNASIYISCNGLLCQKNQVPQLLISPGPGWSRDNGRSGRRLHIPAGRWMTVTAFGRDQWIEQQPSLLEGKVAGMAVRPVFKPLDWEEKVQVKEQYTGGTEYFLCTGAFLPRKNLINLLKAFSLFKKRQQSNWKLLLAGATENNYTAFEKALASYKYRSDVVLAGYLEDTELARLTASAYGMVYPSLYEEVATPVAEAMQAGVPVVASAGTAAGEIAGDAALYADADQPSSIADQMMRLYKDERLRTQMIRTGLEKAAGFSIAGAADRLWAMIEALPRN